MHNHPTDKYKKTNNDNLPNVNQSQVRTGPSSRIWTAAEEFFLAGELIWENYPGSLTFPLVMNYSFSCELSLKSSESKVTPDSTEPDGIIMPVGTHSAVSGHSLYEVFTKLEQKTQDGIEAEFIKEQLNGNENQLVQLLKRCSNYFVISRYAFEMTGGSFALSDVRELAKGLLNAAFKYGIRNEYCQQISKARDLRVFMRSHVCRLPPCVFQSSAMLAPIKLMMDTAPCL